MSLHLNLRHLESADQPIALHDVLQIGQWLLSRKDIKSAAPFEVNLTARLAADVVEVAGESKGEVLFVCSRCLTEYKEELTVPSEHAFTKLKEIADADSEDRIQWINGDLIDLSTYVQEDILLDLPYVPQCNPGCKGLCPQCGTNLNESSCDCKIETIDPRLEKLKQFFKE